ncbi:uncharacterized protein LOC143459555 [Clavelina lepadiformis]|uniref:uncharacterized protein LOC143459555 n=1 Tax=Clavelina lepadiformis TaxID=159417 RepID=UPI0040410D9E
MKPSYKNLGRSLATQTWKAPWCAWLLIVTYIFDNHTRLTERRRYERFYTITVGILVAGINQFLIIAIPPLRADKRYFKEPARKDLCPVRNMRVAGLCGKSILPFRPRVSFVESPLNDSSSIPLECIHHYELLWEALHCMMLPTCKQDEIH